MIRIAICDDEKEFWDAAECMLNLYMEDKGLPFQVDVFNVPCLFRATYCFLTLTILSHICASLFFAKPRFNKIITAVIWLLYSGVFFVLNPDGYINYFISVALHLTLFFVTTTGRVVENGFLFFSYANKSHSE